MTQGSLSDRRGTGARRPVERNGRAESVWRRVSRARLRIGRGAFAGVRPGFWRDRREPRFSGDSDERGTTHVGGIAAVDGGSGGKNPPGRRRPVAPCGRLRPGRFFVALVAAVGPVIRGFPRPPDAQPDTAPGFHDLDARMMRPGIHGDAVDDRFGDQPVAEPFRSAVICPDRSRLRATSNRFPGRF